MGTVFLIIINITKAISGAAMKNITASFASIITAITAAPTTRKGLLVASLMNIFTPFWTVFESFVSLFTREDVPILSISAYESLFICLYNASRSSVPNPYAHFDAKYWQVSANPSPHMPRITITPDILSIYPLSLFPIPLSIILAITTGTISSNIASNNLKSGPRKSSFL